MRATKEQIQAYYEKVNLIVHSTLFRASESIEEQQFRINRAKKDYKFFFETYFPHYAKCDCAPFHIQAARKIIKEPNLRAVFEWARGHAKSTHFNIGIPLWLKINQQIKTLVLVSKSEDNAVTLLSDLQAELEFNPLFIHDFKEQKKVGEWETGEFSTKDGFAAFARGRGQSPRGLRNREHRPDYIVIDDLDDDELVKNEKRVNEICDWVLEALFGALDMGAGRFVMVGNRIHKNSVLAKIAERPNVFHTKINALDANGLPSWQAKYTIEQIQSAIEFMGYRQSQKEFFNNPLEEGVVFKNENMLYKKMAKLSAYKELVCYTDPSFKSSSKNDYKASFLIGKLGNEIHILKVFCRQTSVSNMVKWAYDLEESKPENVIISYYMEANFIQDILLDEYVLEGNARGWQLHIRGDKRSKPDKFQRIEATSPLFERGFIYWNEAEKDTLDMKTAIEQFLAFQKGTRSADDAPDAFEGGLYFLQKRTRFEGETKARKGKFKNYSDRRA